MAGIKTFAVILFLVALFLVACSSNGGESLVTITTSAVQEIDREDIKLDCDYEEELVVKLQNKQEKIDSYQEELSEYNIKLIFYLETGDFTGIQLIKFKVEKALKLHGLEVKNYNAIKDALDRC